MTLLYLHNDNNDECMLHFDNFPLTDATSERPEEVAMESEVIRPGTKKSVMLPICIVYQGHCVIGTRNSKKK
jgi:hypothetical protein